MNTSHRDTHHQAGPLKRHLSRRTAVGRVVEVLIAGAGLGMAASRASAFALSQGTPPALPVTGGAPTVVLVHGAFADASSWAGVVAALQAVGIEVQAPANPLRGLIDDAAYITAVVSQIPGPVMLVGHSYGGAVISNAAPQATNVVGLVYIAAFIPDEGETLQGLAEQATDSLLAPALRPAEYPTGGAAPGTELYVDPASFHDIFAADLPAEQAAVLAASQRPVSANVFGETSGPVGWKTLPTWAVVSPIDLAVGASIERIMAERTGGDIVEINGSHVVMISQPQAVADVILAAVAAVSQG